MNRGFIEGLADSGGFWSIIVAAAAGVLGWRVGAAKDQVRIQSHADRLRELERRFERLSERDIANDKGTAATLSAINSTLSAIATTLNRLDVRLTALEKEHRNGT